MLAPKKLIGVGVPVIPRAVAVAVGIVTDVNPENWNALGPILVTELGIVIDCNWEHASNARLPILVTELPIVTDVNA